MQHVSKAWMAALLSVLNASCAGTLHAQETGYSISTESDKVAEIIRSGNLSQLRPLLATEKITFDRYGAIDENVACFLNWNDRCGFKRTPIQDILKDGYFKFYYHIDDKNVVVSYIKKSSRKAFDKDPSVFLENHYLLDYFSCHFTLLGSRWMLTESICFSETEGPFAQEPEV